MWYLPWHTLLLGAYPVLFLFAQNMADEVTLDPIWVPLAICVAGAAVLLLAAYAIRRDWARAGLMTSAVLALFFTFGHVWNSAAGGSQPTLAAGRLGGGRHRPRRAGLAWRQVGPPTTRLLNIAVALLVVVNVASISVYMTSTRVPTARAGRSPVQVGEAGRPDVYYIVFDRYAGETTLRRFYNYDNTPFLEALEERGFSVAHDSWANYFKTSPSMFSTLTMEHINPDLYDDTTPHSSGRSMPPSRPGWRSRPRSSRSDTSTSTLRTGGSRPRAMSTPTSSTGSRRRASSAASCSRRPC